MLGCIIFLQLNQKPDEVWFWALLPAIVLLTYPNLRIISLILFGMLWTFLQLSIYNDHRLIPELEGQDITLIGVISSIPEHKAHSIQFEFTIDQTSSEIQTPKKIKLNWYTPVPKNIHSDEQWQLRVRLKKVHSMSNPGGFDYERWLFQQGIGATGYVRKSDDNQKLTPAPLYSINSIRQSLLDKINTHLHNSPYIGVIEGLTTGIRRNISKDQWQSLRASGTNHLLAISGLHIGLAAAIGFFCFRKLWSLRAKNLLLMPALTVGACGGFLLALFYAALAGFSIPTQRALIMVALLLIVIIANRPLPASKLLSATMLIILIVDPFAVLSAGVWLSFSAVAIILFISQNRFPEPRWQWLKIHGIITLGLTPLLLLFFLKTSLISPIANSIAIPFISLIIVPLLLVASLMLWLFEPLGALALKLADLLISLFWPVLEFCADLPLAEWSTSQLPFYYYISISVGTLLLLMPRGTPAKCLGSLGFLPLILFSPPKPAPSEVWFTLLDVGQGLSAVIQTHSHTMVFDTGPKYSREFDTGSAVVLPYLQSQGINKVDGLIISHGDNDHIGGAMSLIEAMPVRQIVSSVPERLPNAIKCTPDQSWQWDNVKFTLLYPNKNDHSNGNNLSCVLKVESLFGSILLTGDIEKRAEKLLVQRYGDALNSTVLVAPHHGSNTSSTSSFIEHVSPTIVLFPIGYKNRYRFPHKAVLQRYTKNNSQLFSSAEHGAIRIEFNKTKNYQPTTWRQINKKSWQLE